MALPHLKSLKKPLPPLRLSIRGDTILTRPRFNKGTAFPLAERQSFGLVGRLPQKINTLEEQCARAYEQLQSRETAIRKNSFLQSLKDQNWTLYYALISRHLKELVPVIYTPTQAEAIMNYSHLFRRSEGLYLTFTDQDTMERDFLEQTRGREIDLFVVTDSEAILGIGDQGVGGIGISTAKSVMYTLIGGLDPAKSVAVVLDVGTNNEKLLNDPLYVGWREKRVRGEAYDKFVDKFIQLIRKHHPHSLLHFEDFGVTNAYRLLERYRETHAVFNDDIQGTGAVTLACTMSALGVSPISQSSSSSQSQSNKLSDQRYIIYGAGSAGLGIANQLRDAMVSADGVTREEANSKFYLIDREGLLAEQDGVDRESGLRGEYWRPLSESWSPTTNKLLDVVQKVKPTVLIGCSTSAGAFTKDVVQCMKDGLQGRRRAVIMPLSNPSRLVEATPEDILKWTKGEALVATGSPFGVVREGGREYKIAECNNALIYPGLGFGAILSQSRQITDTMLIAGAQRLAALSPAIRADKDSSSSSPGTEYTGESLLPDFQDAPRVNFEIGVAVAEQAVREGSAQVDFGEGEVRERASERVYVPEYREYVYEEGV